MDTNNDNESTFSYSELLDCLKSAFFLIGVALALFVWILDLFINAVFLQQGTIYQQLTQLELLEIYMRSIISAIIIIFSFIGSVLLNRSRQVEKGRRRYESIVNASDNFMAIVNPDYIYLAINQRFLNLFEKTRDEIVGHSMSEILGEAHFEKFSKPNIDKCLAGEHTNFQNWFTYPTGEKQYHDVNYSRFQDENDAVLGVVISVSNITALKQAHESLQESEEKYRTIVETVSEWIWELDIRTGKCSYSNQMIEKILGYSADEIMAMDNYGTEMHHEEYRAEFETVLKQCIAKKCGWSNMVEYSRHKDGSYRYLESSAAPIFDTDGELIGFRGVSQDITERNKAEEALQKSHQLLSSVIEGTSDEIYVKDIVGRYILVNKATAHYLGKSVTDIIGKTNDDIFPPDVARVANLEDKEVLSTGAPHCYEHSLEKEGKVITRLKTKSVYRDSEGNPLGIVGISRDITERKQAEVTLKKSEELLRLYFDAGVIGMAITVPDKGIIQFNDTFCKILGYPREEVARMQWKEFTHPEDVEIVAKLRNKVLAGETEGYTIDTRYIRKDGGIVHVNVSAWCTRKPDRTVENFVVFIQDITARMQQQQELWESEARFKQIANVSDDVFVISDVKDWSVLYANPAYEQIWGRPVQDLYENYRQWDKGVHPDDRLRIREAWVQMLDQGDRFEEEYRIIRPDGSMRWVRDRAYPVSDYSGQVYRIAGIVQDITDSKRAQQALQEREAMLTDAAKLSTLGYATWNGEKHCLLSVSEENARIFGYSADEYMRLFNTHKKSLKLIHPEDRAQFDAAYLNYIKIGGVRQYEYRIIRKDKQVRHIKEWSRPVKDSAGNPLHILVITQDVTDFKQQQQQLRESEARFQQLAEAIDDVFVVSDVKSKSILYASPAYEQIWGRPVQELYEDSGQLDEGIHPEDRLRIQEAWARMIDQGERFEEEFRVLRPDGSLRWVRSRWYPVRDESGQVFRVAEINQDITDFKRDQQALQEREAMLADAATLSTLGYATWSEEQHCFLSVSEEYARIFGYSADEIMRRFNTHEKSLNLYHPEDRAQFEASYFAQIKTDDVRHNEYRIIRQDKQIRHIKEWARLVKDSAGKPLHTLVTAQDVTDFKRVEAELNQHRAQLENLVEERTAELRRTTEDLESFSYSVSHDLRQPLRAINGFSQALLEDYYESLDDVGRDYLNRVCRASRKMGDLIDSLLSLSRLSRRQMTHEPVWLDALAAEVTQELSSMNDERDVDMVIQEGLEAEGDRTLLKVALMNLMSNAWKFTRDQDPARIEFGATGEPGSRTYFLRDNGIGFDMIYADKLFGAFQRLHKVEEFEGLGIGLATVRRIIERHDGHIWAESKPGEGATFYFTLGTRASDA